MNQRAMVVGWGVLMLASWVPRPGAAQSIPAFPGAEGAGAVTSGGRPVEKLNYVDFDTTGEPFLERRGLVYHVTTLDPDPTGEIEGSLMYGLKNENFWYETHPFRERNIDDPDSFDVEPRIIVFDVGGVIDFSGLPDHQRDIDITPMNVTIAGQTAPGGITLHGGEFNPGYRETWDELDLYPQKYNNMVLRNFSVRTNNPSEKDAIWLAGTRMIADHLSLSWYTDEGVSITDNSDEVTVQHSIVGPGWNNPDGDGSQIEGKRPGAHISVHHNLYLHNDARNPRVGEKEGPGVELDFRNNVIYNWDAHQAGYSAFSTSGGHEPSFTNFVNNYYIGGADNDGNDVIFDTGNNATRIYQSGNLLDRNVDGAANGADLGWGPFTGNEIQQSAPYDVPHGVTQTPAEALETIQNYAGAFWWDRHFLDARAIDQLLTYGDNSLPDSATGEVLNTLDPSDVSAVVNAPSTTRPADYDTDNDGMPDYWEIDRGLDPQAADDWDGDDDGDGYVNLEEFVNELAEWPAPYAIEWSGGDHRYAEILNWGITRPSPDEGPTTTPWQPSRFDEAQINEGTATVDAPGQYAGTVRIGSNPGDTAALDITDGWLRVQDAGHGLSSGTVIIGGDDAATAELNLSGGRLTAAALVQGDGGTFNFTGGVLSVGTVGFDLVNQGGTIAPGSSPGLTHVMGDLAIDDGVLAIEIGGTGAGQFDRVEVDGVATLGGTLEVSLIDLGQGQFDPQPGDSIPFLAASGGTDGAFADLVLPDLASGLAWQLNPGGVTTFLDVVEAAAPVPGDYNGDGQVDAADYTVWRDTLGQSGTGLAADGDGSGTVDHGDYTVWKTNFGMSAGGAAADSLGAVPEPASGVFVVMMTLAAGLRRVGNRRPCSRGA